MKLNAVQTLGSSKASMSSIALEKLINTDDKIYRLAKIIDWNSLGNELAYLFKGERAPSSRLILGLLYLQSIGNLSYADVKATWETSPEWQYFCGEEFFSETFPLHDAALSIWSRVVGEQGRECMTRALGSITRGKTLH